MDEVELTEQQLFQRCGIKLTEEKVQQILEEFKTKAERRMNITATPEIGTIVNGYEIVGYLGTGGFGTVCLAKKNNLYFAMKFLLVNTTQEGPDKEFKILHDLLKSDHHENFLTALEWNEWKDERTKEYLNGWQKKLCYMVMKMVGPSLEMLLKKEMQKQGRGFPIKQSAEIMKNVLKALQFFHEQKFVHYDIKLENFAIDLRNENRIILLDYGMVNRAPDRMKDENLFKGTRSYASRRAIEGKTQSYRDDCESWINSFFELINGGIPWKYNTDSLKERRAIWSPPYVKEFREIMNHIDLLGFHETINFNFVQQCLQDLIDEKDGIPRSPYLYKMSEKKHMQIIKGDFTFNARVPTKKKPMIPLKCSRCNSRIFVDITKFKKAEENDIAIIVDTKNQHECM